MGLVKNINRRFIELSQRSFKLGTFEIKFHRRYQKSFSLKVPLVCSVTHQHLLCRYNIIYIACIAASSSFWKRIAHDNHYTPNINTNQNFFIPTTPFTMPYLKRITPVHGISPQPGWTPSFERCTKGTNSMGTWLSTLSECTCFFASPLRLCCFCSASSIPALVRLVALLTWHWICLFKYQPT